MKNIINKWLKRSMHGSMAVMLVAVLGIGLTMAYFTDVEEAINKVFAGKVTVEIEEDVDIFVDGSSNENNEDNNEREETCIIAQKIFDLCRIQI